MIKLLTALTLLLALCLTGCSSSREQEYPAQDLDVKFYRAGGVSGMTDGLTIAGTGWVRFWTGRSVQMSTVTDSLRLEERQFDRIALLTKSDELYSYHSQTSGELSTTISVRNGSRTAIITYAGTSMPDGAPGALKDLLDELTHISKPTH